MKRAAKFASLISTALLLAFVIVFWTLFLGSAFLSSRVPLGPLY